ncbi:hypothetical protein CRUP_015025 [Coryphaenoides rupestris]|nr:hypothetical protein CRUP_015025 [Coryphaenoides rupestris]
MPNELKRVFASLPQMERGVAKVLGGDPKGNNFLYTNGKCVVIRNIDNPSVADIYTEHPHQVSVAKYAPSGFYIASGDVSGKIRIWDTTQKEHLLKYEYQPFSGKIRDIAWTEDSKRMAAVGEGREKFGQVFLWDSGSTVGEDHARFVNCVRYSPDGSKFATGGADGVIGLYDGKDGEKIRLLGGEKAHNGGVYAVSWSPDGSQLISASGDKTVKLWDVDAGTAITTFNMGKDVMDQQLGCLWQKDHLISIALSGNISYLDKNNPDKPLRVIKVGSQ